MKIVDYERTVVWSMGRNGFYIEESPRLSCHGLVTGGASEKGMVVLKYGEKASRY